MSTNNKTALSLIGIFIVWVVISYAFNLNQADTTTSGTYNTKRNAALSACENGDIPGYTKQQQANYCECFLTTMEKKYPDIFTNDNLIADKVKNGLSKEDTDLIVGKCIK